VLACLRAAAETAQPSAQAVCAAMKAVEKAKLSANGLAEALSGAGGIRRWRLVFTSASGDLRSASGGGRYFPVTAVQSWELPLPPSDSPAPSSLALDGRIVNGVYGGYLFALQFSGPCRLSGKRLEFDFETLQLKVLGWTGRFKLKAAGYALPPRGTREAGKLPFFLFAQADENTVVARGRSGGLAMWARAEPSWVLVKGATLL